MPEKSLNDNYRSSRAWIEVSRDALRHNVLALSSLLPSGCKLMIPIKANAYGHGAVLVAKELLMLNVNDLCVATLEEGIELRKNGIDANILILGYTSPLSVNYLKQYDLTQTVVSLEHATELSAAATEPIKVHIAIDTGMHRIGISADALDQARFIN